MRAYGKLTPKYCLQLANPQSWTASVLPAVFGILYSILRGWELSPLRFAALFMTCVLMQSAVNTFNDYADFVKGTDSKSDHVEVNDAAILYGNLNPKHVLLLGTAYFVIGAALGLAACRGRGVLPVAIGVIGGLVVAAYSAGPLPVSYLPVGEAVSGFVMGGLIPLAITAAASRAFHPEVLVYSLPFILGIALIMLSNNGSDIEKDARAGRRTFAVRMQRERTARIFHGLTLLWFLAILAVSVLFLPGAVVGIVLLFIGSWNSFRYLRTTKLLPENRIRQMKTIASANLTANGAYIVSAASALVWSRLHG